MSAVAAFGVLSPAACDFQALKTRIGFDEELVSGLALEEELCAHVVEF